MELERVEGSRYTVRFNWRTLSHRYHTTHSDFGMSRYVIDCAGPAPRILDK